MSFLCVIYHYCISHCLQEFYKPMLKAGLLNKEQLDSIFLNLDELLHVNKHFITKLKSAINSANQNNDHVSVLPH